jgi:hypothetical protein
MKILITENQYNNVLSTILEQNTKQLVVESLSAAIKCGYKNVDSYLKSGKKCPSKVLINAKKCGWDDILKYEVSKWRCTTGKRGYLSPNEITKLNDLKTKLGLKTDEDNYDIWTKTKISNQDRPDLKGNKDMCKPFCVSSEVSCFIAFVRDNKQKIKSKLGNGVDDQSLSMLIKIAIGIISWQSNYGKTDRLYDIEPKSVFGLFDLHPYDIYKLPFGNEALKMYAKKKGISEPSFGPGEMQISTFEKTGVQDEFGKTIETVVGSGLAIMVRTWRLYNKAKSLGLSSTPSRNEIAQKNGFWKNGINGTGNHLWDIAISCHTWPEEKMIKKYCKTEDPMFAAPCNLSTYQPFKDKTSWESWKNSSPEIKNYYNTTKKGYPSNIKVIQSQPILDYYPMLKGFHGGAGSAGIDSKTMMEFVSGKIGKYDCVNIGQSNQNRVISPDINTKTSANMAGIYTA